MLRIRMLGILSMQYDGKEVDRNLSGNGKILQLFLILAWAGEKGISRGRLQDYLYDVRTDNSGNALRVSLSRLRRQIEESGLAGPGIIQYKNGNYVLYDPRLTVEVDAVCFEEAYNRAAAEEDSGSRLELLEEAAGYYKGEFLPAMSGDSWVESMRGRYQEMYVDCVWEICRMYRKKGQPEKIAALCRTALKVCPMEEWSELLIESLLSLKQYREAKKAYDEAAHLFFGRESQEPSRRRLERFRKMGNRIQMLEKERQDVREELRETAGKKGAYFCNYPGFLDCFHMCARMSERREMGAHLIICSIVSRNGREIQDEKEVEEYSESLGKVMREKLRRGDTYTVYRPGCLLVLLNFVEKKNLERVKERLRSGFRDATEGRATLRLETLKVTDWLKAG